jgi:hypothetical protein
LATAQDITKHDNEIKTIETGTFPGEVRQTPGYATT